MLLTMTNYREPATDLGYLLHKNPARLNSFDLSFGTAHVFYPEATPQRCTAALLLDIDSVGLVRNRQGSSPGGPALDQYVNDRPYAASSILSVALAQVFRTAISGRCRERQDTADSCLPLEARIEALPCHGGERFLRRLFEPLGYKVAARPHDLDEKFPAWGASPYYTVRLEGNIRLRDLLVHLYVLIPVLDNEKHYWVGDDEVEKLLRFGEGWLQTHPEKEEIARRYLKHRRGLVRDALARLVDEGHQDPDSEEEKHAHEEARIEKRLGLNRMRFDSVLETLKRSGARTVLDLGCGEGKLLKELAGDKSFTKLAGLDVSWRALEIARARLRLDESPVRRRTAVELLHGALTYRDRRLEGYDAACLVEVVEHFDFSRLAALERAVFELAAPRLVIVTTPNREYNSKFESLPAGRFRHRDHRFEWSREEFAAWTSAVSARFGYGVSMKDVGPCDPEVGAPTQMAVFAR
jgi:3' terminal RNA ribose 2'-O-methyltransferase Hen1